MAVAPGATGLGEAGTTGGSTTGPATPSTVVPTRPAQIARPDGKALLEIGRTLPGRRECEQSLLSERRLESLRALEQLVPALAAPVLTLLVDENPYNHENALAQLQALGKEAIPAFPVVLWHTDRTWEAAPHELNTTRLLAELGVFVAAAPEHPAVLDYVLQHTRLHVAPGLLADEYQRSQVSSHQQAIRTSSVEHLGRLAKQVEAHRPAVAARMRELLAEPDLRLLAMLQLLHCRLAAVPLLPELDALRLDPNAEVRGAVAPLIESIRREEKYVGRLAEVGIVERDTPRDEYELYLGTLCTPPSVTGTSMAQEFEYRAESIPALRGMCLVRHDDPHTQTAIHRAAAQALVQGATSDRERRDAIQAALLEALASSEPEYLRDIVRGLARIPATALPALRALASNGADPRHVAAANCLDMIEGEICLAVETEGSYGGELLRALGTLDAPSLATAELLAEHAQPRHQPESDIPIAVESWGAIGKSALPTAPTLWIQYRPVLLPRGDAPETLTRTRAAREAAFARLGLDHTGDWEFWASLIAHPDLATPDMADWELRYQAFQFLWTQEKDQRGGGRLDTAAAPIRAAFLRTAAEGLARVRAGNKDPNAKSYGIDDPRGVAVYLAMRYGPEAQEVTPVLADGVASFAANQYAGDGAVEYWVEALAHIGPAGGERAIAALEALAASELRLTARGTSYGNPGAVARRAQIQARTAAALAIVRGEAPVPRFRPAAAPDAAPARAEPAGAAPGGAAPRPAAPRASDSGKRRSDSGK